MEGLPRLVQEDPRRERVRQVGEGVALGQVHRHATVAGAVVYFTDGRGSFPQEDPGVHTLWVLVGSQPFACPWGEQVRMPDTQ